MSSAMVPLLLLEEMVVLAGWISFAAIREMRLCSAAVVYR